MAKVITDKKINLLQLDAELGFYGLCSDENDKKAIIVATADESPITEEELELAIQKHVAVDNQAIKAAEKSALLEKLGITADEAKLLLG